MNEKEQRVAIALAHGAIWQDVPPPPSGSYSRYRPKRLLSLTEWDFSHPKVAPLPFPDIETGDAIQIPDYLNDLNAMHKACLAIDLDWVRYWELLEDITGSRTFDKFNSEDCKAMTHATAAQRAEAFLKTLNLWEES